MSAVAIPVPLSYEEERGKPKPSSNHSWVQANLILEFGRQRQYRVHSELTLDINGQRLTPDIALYSREIPVDLRHDIIRRLDPPLLVVEIFSPQRGTQEVMSKLDSYFTHGVKSCWVVAPPLHSISIYSADGSAKHFNTGLAIDPVLGVTADVDAVFA